MNTTDIEQVSASLAAIGIRPEGRAAYYRAFCELASVGASPEFLTDIAYTRAAGRIHANILRKHGIEVDGA